MFEAFGPSIDSVVNSNYSVALLALVAASESIFLPLPPDIFLIPLALLNPPLSFLLALITTVASLSGGLVGYFLGNKGGKPLVKRFISEEKLYKVRLYYHRYDVWAILIAAFSPIPYKIFTISAGLFDLDLKRFIIASFIGRAGRFFLIATLIFIFGPTIQRYLSEYFEIFTIGIVILLVGGLYLFNQLLKKKV
ncbi:MAG: YqaA family protein [Candidatus Woykebacteria bacterium]